MCAFLLHKGLNVHKMHETMTMARIFKYLRVHVGGHKNASNTGKNKLQ